MTSMCPGSRLLLQVWPLADSRHHRRPPNRAAEMLEHMAGLLAPFATGGNSALRNPLHASAQRWGSALYPLPDGALEIADQLAAGRTARHWVFQANRLIIA